LTAAGSSQSVGSSFFEGARPNHADPDTTNPVVFGASGIFTGGWSFQYDHAPGRAGITPRSTITSVDIAGWTEVVIQGGPRVLSDVIFGSYGAEVNASINDVADVASGVPGFEWTGDRAAMGCICGYPGSSVVDDNSFSCSNNNEVTI
jgi:hypothetical protein